jgi:hypothetical protein
MRLRRPSHATVIAYLALFVALSGTAMAVKKIGPSGLKKNAVKTKKIADSAVTTPKIANGAVTTPKLGDSAVTEGKLAPDSVSGSKIQQAVIGTGKLRDGAVETDKIADNAVTGAKVLEGSLALADTAEFVVNATPDPPSIPLGLCEDEGVNVPGAQPGDYALALPQIGTTFDPDLFVVASGVASADTVAVWFCNLRSGGSAFDPTPQPIQIAVFR